ncbi:MAG: glycosyltransferase family 4 protein [Nostocoides sp.]
MASRPRVAMIVNNGIANDARVIKSAVSLARAGADVTVLGIASAGAPRQEATAGGVRYLRLPALPARSFTPAYLRFALRRRLGRLYRPENIDHSLAILRLYTDAFTSELRALRPDVVHVHDVHGLAAAAVLTNDPGAPRIIYDAHEYVAGLAVSGNRTQRAVDAWAAVERASIGAADRVITVSTPIAQRLQADHALNRPPEVVLNCPIRWQYPTSSRDLRDEAGLPGSTPLVVYSGAVSMARGLDTAIDALIDLPGIHLAIVTVPYPHPLRGALLDQANRIGVADRVHLVPPVPSHEVPAYLAGADIGLSPIRGDAVSYDLALPNKLFEFIHAGLPVVTSDLAEMGSFVRRHDIGEVFPQGDAAACASAVKSALSRPIREEQLSALAERYSWQRQERTLIQVYRSLASQVDADGLIPAPQPWEPADLAVSFPS